MFLVHYNRDHTSAAMSIYVCSSTWEGLLYLHWHNLLLEGSQMSPKAANFSTVTCLHVCMYICMCNVCGPTHGHSARLLCTACSQGMKLPSDMQMFHCDCDLIRSRTLHYINGLNLNYTIYYCKCIVSYIIMFYRVD